MDLFARFWTLMFAPMLGLGRILGPLGIYVGAIGWIGVPAALGFYFGWPAALIGVALWLAMGKHFEDNP